MPQLLAPPVKKSFNGIVAPTEPTQYRAIGSIVGKLVLGEKNKGYLVVDNFKYSVYLHGKLKHWLRKHSVDLSEKRQFLYWLNPQKNGRKLVLEIIGTEKLSSSTKLGLSIYGSILFCNSKNSEIGILVKRNQEPTKEQKQKQPWAWRTFKIKLSGKLQAKKGQFWRIDASLHKGKLKLISAEKIADARVEKKSTDRKSALN